MLHEFGIFLFWQSIFLKQVHLVNLTSQSIQVDYLLLLTTVLHRYFIKINFE